MLPVISVIQARQENHVKLKVLVYTELIEKFKKYTQLDQTDEISFLLFSDIASLKAKIKIISNQSSTDIGDTIRLECLLDGENMTKIYWTHIEHSRLPDHMDSNNGILVIRGVSRKDGGIYRCHVETNAGVLSRDFLLTIPGEFD